MGRKKKGSISNDIARYGDRLKNYLPALQKITESLSQRPVRSAANGKDIDGLLTSTLPHLLEGFNSELSFIADEKGEVVYTSSENNIVKKENLANIPLVKTFIKKEGYAAINFDETFDPRPDLYGLSLYSLMVVRYDTPVGLRYVGVVNGGNEPPYLGEDKIFLDEIIKILFLGLRYGKENAQRDHFWENYLHAKKRGDWEALSFASKEYINMLIGLGNKNKSIEHTHPPQIPKHCNNYSVLTDHFDAKLCNFIKSIFPRSVGNEPLENLLKEVNELINNFGNNEPKECSDDFNRTLLALARIFLYAKNFNEEILRNIVPSSPNGIWNGVEKLLDNDKFIYNNSSSYCRIDWLRTKWQQIYYLSRQGILEPDARKLKRINEIYKSVWKRTIRIIKSFLQRKTDLYIDSDWLISWLASNILLSKRLKEQYDLIDSKEDKLLNPIGKMRYLKYLSHHVLYVLHCSRFALLKEKIDKDQMIGKKPTKRQGIKEIYFIQPPFADIPVDETSSLSQAQLYLMSEYAYREIGVHRELRIFERLSQQLSHELPLYAASNFYRDHLYHVIDVCLLGELILRSLIPIESIEKPTEPTGYNVVESLFTKPKIKNLLCNWYVAALCHDIGYVIEQSEKFLNPISEIKGEGLSDFSEKLKDGIEKGKKEIKETITKIKSNDSIIPPELVEKLINDEVTTDHGVAAWLHLRQWIKDIKCPMDSFAPALIAILRHNLSDQEADLHKEPLSFLLILCDHIQEWGRPRVGPEPLARGIMEGLRFGEKPKLDRKVRMNKILVTGLNFQEIDRDSIPESTCNSCILKKNTKCNSVTCLRVLTKIEDKKLEFRLPHVEACEADFEPCISWLTFCRDLQCIKPQERDMPFSLSIIMEHTPPRIWSAIGWNPLEMDIFEEFASTHPKATYLLEWIDFARNKRQGIEYIGNRKKGTETFIIKLNELGRPLSRGLSQEHWKNFFQWKWKWLSNKFTASNLGTWFPENLE